MARLENQAGSKRDFQTGDGGGVPVKWDSRGVFGAIKRGRARQDARAARPRALGLERNNGFWGGVDGLTRVLSQEVSHNPW